MTVQSKRLLKHLKKAQATPDGTIYIDFENMTVSGVHAKGEDFVKVNLEKYRNSIHSILQYLKDQEYIEYTSMGHGKVLHTGWHIAQTAFASLSRFLFKSILVPITVSLLTTVLIRVVEAFL